MEFMLLLWDEWDDLTGACQHLVTSAADELTGISTSIAAAAAASAVTVWVVSTQAHFAASLITRASFWMR